MDIGFIGCTRAKADDVYELSVALPKIENVRREHDSKTTRKHLYSTIVEMLGESPY